MVSKIALNPGTCFEYEGKFRIEVGPVLKTAIATKELLSDEVTASHYHAAKLDDDGKPIPGSAGRDAVGREIVLGEEMTYLDWNGEKEWKIYRLEKMGEKRGAELKRDPEELFWTKIDAAPTFEEAEAIVLSMI